MVLGSRESRESSALGLELAAFAAVADVGIALVEAQGQRVVDQHAGVIEAAAVPELRHQCELP